MKLVEFEKNRWRILREARPVARSNLPLPYVISDEMPETEQVDGRFYTSKAAFRAVGRALGLTEVGTEKFEPKLRGTADPTAKRKRREVIGRAIAQYKEGRRAQRVG